MIRDGIRVENDLTDKTPSQFSDQSFLHTSYLNSVNKRKAKSIIYGGRGPKSCLQNKIGLDKTTGYQYS